MIGATSAEVTTLRSPWAVGRFAVVGAIALLVGCASPRAPDTPVVRPSPTASVCTYAKQFVQSWPDADIYLATVTADDCSEYHFLGLEGEINHRNLALLQAARHRYVDRERLDIVGVMFNSPGGEVGAAFEMGGWIFNNQFATFIPSGMYCASACTIAFMAGDMRLMEKGAYFGVHSAYNEDGQPSPVMNELMGYLVEGMGGNGEVYTALAHGTPPGSMTWLSAHQASSMNFATAVF